MDVLLTSTSKFPLEIKAMEIVRFEERWEFPQCFAAIDGNHIPIIPPHDSPTDYYNRKGFHSIVLQGLVDHQHRFLKYG